MRITTRLNHEIALTPSEMIPVTLEDATVVQVDRIYIEHHDLGHQTIRFTGWYREDIHADTEAWSSVRMAASDLPTALLPLLSKLEGGTVVDQDLAAFLAGQ